MPDKKYFSGGGGSLGCLYDYMTWAASRKDIIKDLAITYDLSPRQRRALSECWIVYLRKHQGADYCEFQEISAEEYAELEKEGW